jgi:gluconate 2-dehydrogenase gamma chain
MDRRGFIVAGLAGTAAGCAGSKSPWRTLSISEAGSLEAICAHIIPRDQHAGAVEAGVVVYMDRQLAGFYAPLRKTYREGLAAMDAESVRTSGHPFADLPAAAQLDVLRHCESAPETRQFFDLLVAHTMQGFYGDPRHGGNRDRASWRMLGVSSPPLRGRA